MKKQGGFKGRDAVEKQRSTGLKKMMACFSVDSPDVILVGRETIYRNGEAVGWLSSGGFGHTLQMPIGYGYVRHNDGVDADFLLQGEYELEVATERVPCNVHLEALYDPKMLKIR
jgi:4-methylaminobutanoate oxidase (formaldehyde-forming)